MAVGIPMTKPAAPFARAGDEPALADLLADPVLHTLMRCDRLSEGDLRTAIERGRAALRLRG
jgi:hypothetical protein